MKHERSRDLSVKPKSLTKHARNHASPSCKVKTCRTQGPEQYSFPSGHWAATFNRNIPSAASQHAQPGVARGTWVDGGTWTQGIKLWSLLVWCGRTQAVRFVTADICSERATKIRQYDLLRPTFAQKEPPRSGSTICYGRHLLRKSHQDPAVRFVTADICSERAAKIRRYELLRPTSGKKNHQDPAVRFVTADKLARAYNC